MSFNNSCCDLKVWFVFPHTTKPVVNEETRSNKATNLKMIEYEEVAMILECPFMIVSSANIDWVFVCIGVVLYCNEKQENKRIYSRILSMEETLVADLPCTKKDRKKDSKSKLKHGYTHTIFIIF